MRKSLSRLCALGLTAAMTLGSFVPTQAAPVVPMRTTTSLPAPTAGAPAAEVVPVQYRQGNRQIRRGDRRHMRRNDFRRHDRRQIRRDARRDYYNGHRGYRNQRRGYRRHNGYWFPPAAFIAGAIIGGATSNRGVSSAHIRSCQSRYRSYRASDNTFQPYNGPRQQCR